MNLIASGICGMIIGVVAAILFIVLCLTSPISAIGLVLVSLIALLVRRRYAVNDLSQEPDLFEQLENRKR